MNAPWRVGRSLGRTLYQRVYTDHASKDDHFVGIMDTRELAEQVVDAVNAVARLRALHRPERIADGIVECSHCYGPYAGDTLPWPCPTIRAIDGSGNE